MSNSNYVLVEYLDEKTCGVDIHGFKVMHKNEWEQYLVWVKSHVIFPTEEAWGEWYEFSFQSYDDYLSYYSVEEISDSEAEVLNKLFKDGYGTFYMFDDEDVDGHDHVDTK